MNVSFVGRLGADAEKRVTPNGVELYTLSVACAEKNSKEKETIWIKVSLAKHFEKLIPYLKKGSCVFVSGSLKPPKISEKTGKVRLFVSGHSIEFVGGKEQTEDKHEQSTFF